MATFGEIVGRFAPPIEAGSSSGDQVRDPIAATNSSWRPVLEQRGARLVSDVTGDMKLGELPVPPNHVKNISDLVFHRLSPDAEASYRALYAGAPVLEDQPPSL